MPEPAASADRSSNPLAGITRKPASYVGNLDELLDQTTTTADEQGGGTSARSVPVSKRVKEEMKIKEPPPQSRINLLLPAPLHRQFKATAAAHGVTMTSVLEAFIRDYVAGGSR